MKHLCFNFSSLPPVSHTHTCGPARTLKLGEAASFDKPFPFSLNTTSSCWCRYVLREEGESLPRSHINIWNPFVRCELKIYAVSLPWSPTVAYRSSPQRPRSKRLWKIKDGAAELGGGFLLVCSHLLRWHIRLYDVLRKSTFVLCGVMFHHITEVYRNY